MAGYRGVPNRRDQFAAQIGETAKMMSDQATAEKERESALSRLIKGKEMDLHAQRVQQMGAEEAALTKAEVDDQYEQAAQKRAQRDAMNAYHANPKAAISVGKGSFSINPETDATQGPRALAQKRLEAQALNNVYVNQTKPIKEKQQKLQDIAPLMSDPSNIDDQQLRRALAQAVNTGALSDQDVEDALPGDVELMARKGWNYIQPALAWTGAEKAPVYSEGTRNSISKLVTGKLDPLERQLTEAGSQVRDLAPTVAPSIFAEGPETLEQLFRGIEGPRKGQQTRITGDINAATGAPQQPGAPRAPQKDTKTINGVTYVRNAQGTWDEVKPHASN
jgi:hypothetical protein